MIGVNVNYIETMIKKNNFNLNSFNSDSAKLLNVIGELNECYSGESIKSLFNRPIEERKNINKISKVIESYSYLLNEVKRSYQAQDINLKTQVNRLNLNTK